MTSPYGVFPSGPFDPRYGQYRNEGGVFYPPVPTRVESAEEVRDIVGAALRAGTNVSIVVNDAGDTITISATGGTSYTDEQVRDAVAAALRAGTGVTITNDDAGDTITIAATGLQVDTTGAAVGGVPTATQVTNPGQSNAQVTEWKVISESAPTPARFRQAGDADDTAAFTRLFATNPAAVRVPPKPSGASWDISAGLMMPAGCDIEFDPGVTLKAIAAITGPMLDTPVATRMTRRWVRGGIFDCNDLADNGIYLRNYSDFRVSDFEIRNPVGDGMILADPSTGANPPTGAKIADFKIGYPITHAAHAANAGIRANRCTDGWFDRGSIVGCTTGVYIGAQGGGNLFYNIHPWGWPSALVQDRAFDDYGKNNKFFGCLADTCAVTGWHFRNSWANPRIIGGGYFNYQSGNDNVSVGVKIEGTGALGTFLAMTFEGFNGTSRIARGFDLDVDTAAIVSTGHTYENVVAGTKNERFLVAGRYPMLLAGYDDAPLLRVRGIPGNFRRGDWLNGILLRGYSDDTTTERWSLDSATGATKAGRYTTAGRPSASTAGAGAQLFDTTLGKPIWSDGTNWRDATGTAI